MNTYRSILAFFFAAVFFCGQVPAVTLSLEPSSQTIDLKLGEKARLDLVISGLVEGGPPSLGAFGVQISFNEKFLSFDSVTYGSFLGDPNNPTETSIETTQGVGFVFLDEFSFLSADGLDQLQPASFLLASLIFEGSRSGASHSGLKFVDLSDAVGNTLAKPILVDGATINVVPLPASLGLFSGVTGLLLGWGPRKRAGRSFSPPRFRLT